MPPPMINITPPYSRINLHFLLDISSGFNVSVRSAHLASAACSERDHTRASRGRDLSSAKRSLAAARTSPTNEARRLGRGDGDEDEDDDALETEEMALAMADGLDPLLPMMLSVRDICTALDDGEWRME